MELNHSFCRPLDTNFPPPTWEEGAAASSQPAEGIRPSGRPDGFDTFRGARRNTAPGQGKTEANAPFSWGNAGKAFGKGLLSPVLSLIKHPLMAIGMLAAGAAVAAAAPITIPLMVIGFTGFSLFQAGKGIYQAVSRYAAGDMRGAERAFEDIGAGLVGSLMSLFGLRESTAIAAEGQATAKALKAGDSIAKATEAGMAAGLETRGTGLLKQIETHYELLKSRDGWAAIAEGLNPSNIAMNARLSLLKLKRLFNGPEPGIYAGMKNEEIHAKFTEAWHKACRDKGIPDELIPEIKILEKNKGYCSGFNLSQYIIEYHPATLTNGNYAMENVAAHEAEHLYRTLIQAQLENADCGALADIAGFHISSLISRGEEYSLRAHFGKFTGLNESGQPAYQNIALHMQELPAHLRPHIRAVVEKHGLLSEEGWEGWYAYFKHQALQEEENALQALLTKQPQHPHGKNIRQRLTEIATEQAKLPAGSNSEAKSKSVQAIENAIQDWMKQPETKAWLERFPEDFRSQVPSYLFEYVKTQPGRIYEYLEPIRQVASKVNLASLPPVDFGIQYIRAIEGLISQESNIARSLPSPNPNSPGFLAYFFSREELAARKSGSNAELETVNAAIKQLGEPKTAEAMLKLRHLVRQKISLDAENGLNQNLANRYHHEKQRRRKAADAAGSPKPAAQATQTESSATSNDVASTSEESFLAQWNQAIASHLKKADGRAFPQVIRPIIHHQRGQGWLNSNQSTLMRGAERPPIFNPAFIPHLSSMEET